MASAQLRHSSKQCCRLSSCFTSSSFSSTVSTNQAPDSVGVRAADLHQFVCLKQEARLEGVWRADAAAWLKAHLCLGDTSGSEAP